MHLPLPRDRQMQRIELSADHHHAIFARIAVLAAGIEIFDHQQIVARQAWRPRRIIHSAVSTRTKLRPV